MTEFERGAAYGSSAVKKRLLSKRTNLVRSSGGIPVVEDSLATTTVSKYICAVANHCGVSIVNKATNKLRTRINSGKSKRRLACYIGLLGSVLFVDVAEEDRDIQNELKTLPAKTRLLYDIVREVRGTEVYPVKNHNH